MKSKPGGNASRLFERKLDETAQRAADACERTRQTMHDSSRLLKQSGEAVSESRRRVASIREAREKRRQQRSG